MDLSRSPIQVSNDSRFALGPIIARAVPFEQILEAQRYLESNQPIGEIVVTV